MDGVRPPVRPSRHERRREEAISTKSRCKGWCDLDAPSVAEIGNINTEETADLQRLLEAL
jgi:hypothetical protein